MRINQYIASAGITSRRKADELIEDGRVKVNGAVLTSPGYHVEEGDIVEAMVHAASDTILTCELPANVVLEITYTEPGIKGDTATNTLKPATVETGTEIRVPLFCNIGDKVRVDTRTGNYLERVKA